MELVMQPTAEYPHFQEKSRAARIFHFDGARGRGLHALGAVV